MAIWALAAVALVLLGSASPSFAVGGGCTEVQVDTGACRAEGLVRGDEDAIDLVGVLDGSPAVGTSGNAGDDNAYFSSPAPPPPPPPANCSPNNVTICAGDPAAPPEEPAAPIVVTLRDIASFRPATPGNRMEPGGWAVVGLPANFVAASSVEVVSGTLLGQPADVRFTPVGYRWSHSDGGIVESGTAGETWAALGQREFSTTATSHIYAAPGEYTAELEVVLRAEYRFAGSAWRSIAGTLAVAGPSQRVLVGEFDTVLTRGDCNADPSGPGC